jgi:hypothetical protein
MQELLLIFACISDKGCPETASTYAHYNKYSIEQLEITAKAVEQRINGAYTPYLVAVYTVYTGKAVILTVNQHTNMEFNHENVRINYNIEY